MQNDSIWKKISQNSTIILSALFYMIKKSSLGSIFNELLTLMLLAQDINVFFKYISSGIVIST